MMREAVLTSKMNNRNVNVQDVAKNSVVAYHQYGSPNMYADNLGSSTERPLKALDVSLIPNVRRTGSTTPLLPRAAGWPF